MVVASVLILFAIYGLLNTLYIEDSTIRQDTTTTTDNSIIVIKQEIPIVTTTTTKVTTTTTQPTTTTTTSNTTVTTTTTPAPTTTITTTTTTAKPVTTTTPKPTTTTTTSAIQFTKKGECILPYELTDNDWYMICKVVSSETGYCGEKQQKAVAYTIFNRIIIANKCSNSPYPNSVYGILHQKNQYNAINYWRKDSKLHPGGSLWNNTMRIIKEAAYESDFTNGAIGYYNPRMCGYISSFENNSALQLCYADSDGRFFKLKGFDPR
jgi:hypothetical protein